MQIREPHSVESTALPEAEEPSLIVPVAVAPAPDPASAWPPIAAGIVALSDDALLLEALAGAAGAPVTSSPSSDRFVDQLVASGAAIVLIDAACVAASLRGFLVMLREQFPQLVLLVVGSAQVQNQVAGQIADGTVFRFVHKPASSQRLRLFLEAASRRHAGASTAELRALTPPEAAAATPVTGGSQTMLFGGIALGALAALAIAWAVMRGGSRPDSAANPSPAADAVVAPAAAPAPQDNTSAPAGISLAPLSPLGLPSDPLSVPGSQRDAPKDASAAPPAHDAALEAAQRTAQGARAEQLALYLQLARKRIASGALIQPADDSAVSYLESAKALAPGDPEVRATTGVLGEALMAQFHSAIDARDPVQARHWLVACTDFHLSSSQLAQLTGQLSQLEASLPQHAAAAEAAPAPAPAAAPPPVEVARADTVAAATPFTAAPVEPAVISESALKRVSFVTPSYPRAALERNLSGWVDMEFTVTPEGRVTDVQVTAAEPHDTFERVAKAALQACRYEPVLRNGVPVAQRARMRVRFKP